MAYNDLRIFYLYEFKLKHNGAEAARRLNMAFGCGTIGQRTLRRWYEKFRQNDFDLSKGPHAQRHYNKSHNNNGERQHELGLLIKNKKTDFKFHQLKELDKLMLYEFKIGRTPAIIVKNINDQFGTGSIDQATVEKWFDKFRNNHVVVINVDKRMSDVSQTTSKTKTNKQEKAATAKAIENLSKAENGKMNQLKSEVMAKTKTKTKKKATTQNKTIAKKTTKTTTKENEQPLNNFKIKMKFNGKKKKK